MGPEEKKKVLWAKKYGKGSTYDDSRPSSSFLSRPRPPLLARPAADLSDVLQRDRAHWTAKGCFTGQQVCLCERGREREVGERRERLASVLAGRGHAHAALGRDRTLLIDRRPRAASRGCGLL